MNKLDKLIEKSIEDSYVENYYPEFSSTLSESLISDKIKEITSDVAIKFAEWLYRNRWFNFEDDKWSYCFEHGTSISDESYEKNYRKTTEELFNEFINNHYE